MNILAQSSSFASPAPNLEPVHKTQSVLFQEMAWLTTPHPPKHMDLSKKVFTKMYFYYLCF